MPAPSSQITVIRNAGRGEAIVAEDSVNLHDLKPGVKTITTPGTCTHHRLIRKPSDGVNPSAAV